MTSRHPSVTHIEPPCSKRCKTANPFLRQGWALKDCRKARRPVACLTAVNGQHAVYNAHTVSFRKTLYNYVVIIVNIIKSKDKKSQVNIRYFSQRWERRASLTPILAPKPLRSSGPSER